MIWPSEVVYGKEKRSQYWTLGDPCGKVVRCRSVTKPGYFVVDSSNPILNAISAMKGGFVLRFDGLFSVNTWVSDLKAVSSRVTEAEDRIGTNQDDVASLKTQTSTMKAAIEELVSQRK